MKGSACSVFSQLLLQMVLQYVIRVIDLLQNCTKGDTCTRVLFLAQCKCINLYCSKFFPVQQDITGTRVATTQQHGPCQVVTAAASAGCILMHAFYFEPSSAADYCSFVLRTRGFNKTVLFLTMLMHLSDASSKCITIDLKIKYCYTVFENLCTFEHLYHVYQTGRSPSSKCAYTSIFR